MGEPSAEAHLVDAVTRGSLEEVNEILEREKGLNVNNCGEAIAAAHNQHRWNPSSSGSLLHICSSTYEADGGAPRVMMPLLERLLQAGAAVDCRDVEGRTALHWACHGGTEWAITQLVDAGSGVNLTGDDGNTPLHVLCMSTPASRSFTGVRLLQPLLRAGADPTIQRPDGLRPYDMCSPTCAAVRHKKN